MIAFIREHKDQRILGHDGVVGLRWGVEPMCAVLTEHGIQIAPATYYEWVDKQPPSAKRSRAPVSRSLIQPKALGCADLPSSLSVTDFLVENDTSSLFAHADERTLTRSPSLRGARPNNRKDHRVTLLVGSLNSTAATITSDRRLTAAGTPVDDEANKAILAVSWDARLVMAFTGLARYGELRMDIAILNAFNTAAEVDEPIDVVLPAFAATLDAAIPSGVPRADRALTILALGFQYPDEHTSGSPRAWRISNFEAADGSIAARPGDLGVLDLLPAHEAHTLPLVVSAGQTGALHSDDLPTLRALSAAAPLIGVQRKLFDVIDKAADHLKGGTIGKQATVCTVLEDRAAMLSSLYYSAHPTQTMHGTAVVVRPGADGGGILAYDVTVTNGLDLGPYAIPKASRNEPCPCGSGVKYKRCHLLLATSRWGPFQQVDLGERVVPSGRKFTCHATVVARR